ncbi:MAG: hypothetical protein WCG75_12100, partial [Armatimonadota bacterium]
MALGSQFESVQYSKESCLQFGNEGTACVLWSYDIGKNRSFYFACFLNHERRELRVFNERTEQLTGEYNNEKIYKDNPLVVPFDRIPALLKVTAEIKQLGE